MGIRHIRTTTYHPQSNGLIERVHRVIKTALRTLEDKENWVQQVPYITLMLNNQVSDRNSYTPYQMVFGMNGRLPGQMLFPEEEEDGELPMDDRTLQVFCELMTNHQRQARPLNSSAGYVDKALENAHQVWVRKEGFQPTLEPLYEGPYIVIQRFEKYVIILSWEGEKKISIDRLKTAYVLDEEGDESEEDVPECRPSSGSDSEGEETDSRLIVRSADKRRVRPPNRLNL